MDRTVSHFLPMPPFPIMSLPYSFPPVDPSLGPCPSSVTRGSTEKRKGIDEGSMTEERDIETNDWVSDGMPHLTHHSVPKNLSQPLTVHTLFLHFVSIHSLNSLNLLAKPFTSFTVRLSH